MTDAPDDFPAAVAFTMPLDEFCADISRSDRRVELIACFRYREMSAGRHHDTPANYAERYAAAHRVPA